MAAAGLRVHDDWMWFASDAGESARQAVRNILDSADPPTAILGSNANVSLAMLSVAKERGLRVGVDISLIGFDDAPWAPVVTPGLSVVDLPIEAMAEAAVENLLAQITASDTPTTTTGSIVLPMRLIARGSVGPVPANRSFAGSDEQA